MTAVSDGSSSLRPLVDAAISASCEALAAAEEAEQVKRVLRVLARALLSSERPASSSSPLPSPLITANVDADSAPKAKATGKAAEEACVAAERSIAALEERLTREEGKGDESETATATTSSSHRPSSSSASRAFALSLSFPPLADALLSLVAPDWLDESFTEEESRALFDAFFQEAGAEAALEACCDHLASVQPLPFSSRNSAESIASLPFGPSSSSRPPSTVAAAPGARAAARLLASRFVEGSGVRELLLPEKEAAMSAAARRGRGGENGRRDGNNDDDDDGDVARAERLAAALAACPDRAAAAGCVELLEGGAAAGSFARQAVEAVAASAAAVASSPSPSPFLALSSVALATALLLTRLSRRGLGTPAAFGAFQGAAAAAAEAAVAANPDSDSTPPPLALGEVLSRVEDSAAAEALLRGLLLCCAKANSDSSAASPNSSSFEQAGRAAASLVELAGPKALTAPAALFVLSDKFLTGRSTLPPLAAAVVAPLLASLSPISEFSEAGKGERRETGKRLPPPPLQFPSLRSSLLPRALGDASRAWSAPGAALGTPPHVAGYASAQLVAGLAVFREALREEEEEREGKKEEGEESSDPTALLDACSPGLVPALLSGVGARLDSPLEAHRAQAMRVGGALAAVLGFGGGGHGNGESAAAGRGPFALFAGCGDLGLFPEERWSSDCGAGSWRLFGRGDEAAEKKPGAEKQPEQQQQQQPTAATTGDEKQKLQSPLADSDDEFIAPRTLARETPGSVLDWRAEAEKQKSEKKQGSAAATTTKALLPAAAPSSLKTTKKKAAKPTSRSPFSFRFDLAPLKPPRDPEALDLVSSHAEGAPTAAQRAAGVAAGLDSGRGRPAQLRDVAAALRKADDDPGGAVAAVRAARKLLGSRPVELRASAAELAGALLQARLPEWADDDVDVDGVDGDDEEGTSSSALAVSASRPLIFSSSLPATAARAAALVDLVALEPEAAGSELAKLVYSPHLDTHQRLLALDTFTGAARALAAGGIGRTNPSALEGKRKTAAAAQPLLPPSSSSSAAGAGAIGKSRVWGSAVGASPSTRTTSSTATVTTKKNLFLPHAVPWATALLAECDVERHGVDLFGRDALLLGRLMTTLAAFVGSAVTNTAPGSSVGVAAPLAAALLELASSPDVRRSPSPYVRRCALASAASVAGALPPTALLGGGGAEAAAERESSSAVAPWDRRLQSALDATAAHAATAAATDADPNVRLLASAARRAFSALATRTLELRTRRDLLSSGGGTGVGLGLLNELGGEARIRLPPSRDSLLE